MSLEKFDSSLIYVSYRETQIRIYEVPLSAAHHLREALNAILPEHPIKPEVFEPFDSPVIAAREERKD